LGTEQSQRGFGPAHHTNRRRGTMKVRYIQCTPKDGSLTEEQITFTDDFESHGYEFCPPDMTLYTDRVIEIDLPVGFPINSTFAKVY
jgi:hypothetical protein